MYVNLYCYVL